MAAAVNVWRPRPTCLSATVAVARHWSCGGGAEAGCPPPALHLALVVMDSQSISMNMVWRDDLEELAPFITNEDVEALCDAYGGVSCGSRSVSKASSTQATTTHPRNAIRFIEMRGLEAGGSCGLGG
jgi:hypothetical protein